MDLKATGTFSYNGKVYHEGDAVHVDEVSAEKLLERKQVAKGKGKEAEKEKGILAEANEKARAAHAEEVRKEKVKKSDNPGSDKKK